MDALFTIPQEYKPTRLKTLPLRDQPAYKVASNPLACNLSELLASVIGGPHQIETAEALMTAFSGDIQLFVGPASAFLLVHMYVRCSVLATSFFAVRW